MKVNDVDLSYVSLTQEQGEMIVDRLLTVTGALVDRLKECHIEIGVVMFVSTTGRAGKQCRAEEPIVAKTFVNGTTSSIMHAFEQMDGSQSQLKDHRKRLKLSVDAIHMADHASLFTGEKNGHLSVTDEELMSMMTSIVSDDEASQVLATAIKSDRRENHG